MKKDLILLILILLTMWFNTKGNDVYNHRRFEMYDVSKSKYDKLLDSGIEAFYKTDWQKAEQIFGDLKQIDKNDPRAYFLDSLIPFWSYFFAGEQKKDANEFLDISEKAITLSKSHLTKNPSDTNMVLMLSALYGYRSLVSASEKSYSTAIKSAMTGFKYTRQILSLDSNDPRALIGKGIFYYMLGSVPTQARWITNMMGLKGDVEMGLDQLKQASSSDSYVSTDARMILYYLFEREQRHQLALEQITYLAKKYPDNLIFQYKLAECEEEMGNLKSAKDIYRAISNINNPHLQTLRTKSRKKLNSI